MTARPGLGLTGGPRPVAHVGPATVTLVNGIFGDPLLHLRLRQQKRSLLFDLGEAGRLPARIAHQVTDVFISHAHIDHIAGFVWLLRSRIGELPPCRVYGPPGLIENIEGLMCGVHWDRVGDRGPSFQVAELHDQRLVSARIQAGRPRVEPLGEQAISGGILLEESGFRVRADTLDHGTPVLAFAFEPSRQLKVREDLLSARGLPTGPWLGDLKRCVASGQLDEPIELPDGRAELAGPLAHDLITVIPPQKLVYATDLADSANNRDRLTVLAHGAHTFFCEAAFVAEDADQARRTRHLTARACGEIAAAARTERLVPFHLSRRYVQAPDRVYEEVQAACPRTLVPPSLESSMWTV